MNTEYRLTCVSCDTYFVLKAPEEPSYCPFCGLPRNERFGLEIAKSNPNITGFR